jgi:hypothetical protein
VDELSLSKLRFIKKKKAMQLQERADHEAAVPFHEKKKKCFTKRTQLPPDAAYLYWVMERYSKVFSFTCYRTHTHTYVYITKLECANPQRKGKW